MASGATGHQAALDTLRQLYRAPRERGLPKHARLQSAVLSAIAAGAWRPGDQVPPEQQITRAIDVSLGTVQRALSLLAADGVIVREHGRGTFVSDRQALLDEVWQFRFSRPGERGLLPVSSTILGRRRVVSPGPWTEALGRDAKGFVEISRRLAVASSFRFFSRFYVGMTRFEGLLSLPLRALDPGNFKVILRDQFAAPTLSISQRIRIAGFDAEICDAIGVPADTTGVILDSVGFSYGEAPLSFQTVWIPPNECSLDMSRVDWDSRREALS